MTLQETITKDMRAAIKGPKDELSALRFLVGEFTHLPDKELAKYPNKQLTDEKVISIIRKCLANENSLDTPNSTNVRIWDSYLPKAPTEDEIHAWIRANIDFTALKTPKAAIGIVKKHFGGSVEGSVIQRVIESMVV